MTRAGGSKINHFITHYKGNKRNECPFIMDALNFSRKNNIVEPFAGSCAMSFFIWKRYQNCFNYYINDIDAKLYEIYILLKTTSIEEIEENINRVRNELLSNENRPQFHKSIFKNNRDIYDYIFVNKYCMYGMSHLCLINTEFSKNEKRLQKPFKISPLQKEFIKFLKSPNVFITNDDFKTLYEEHKNNSKSIILLDPPYVNTHSSFYQSNDIDIYKYFSDNSIKKNKASTYVIVDDNWIMRLVFKDCHILSVYDKKYEIVHKKVKHIIFSNK